MKLSFLHPVRGAAPSFIEHPELGRIVIRSNARAVRFTFRVSDKGELVVTTPTAYRVESLRDAIDALKPRLMKMLVRKRPPLIDASFVIDQPDFQMRMQQDNVPRLKVSMRNGTLTICYPQDTDFSEVSLQEWLVGVTEEALRHRAKLLLPGRLSELARRFGLQYSQVKIHKSHGRWGSCSSRGNINLSLYLLLLPRPLQDYVMLHELTHTLHMNHSERFWAQLKQFCPNSLALRRELSNYTTSIFFRKT